MAAVQLRLDVGLRQRHPGGQPSITQPMAGPWLSPKLVTRNKLPKVLPDIWEPAEAGETEAVDSAAALPSRRHAPRLRHCDLIKRSTQRSEMTMRPRPHLPASVHRRRP